MQQPLNLYTRQQVYQLDQIAIQQGGQPSTQLMGKAAMATWKAIQYRWPSLNKVVILAGSGNNGGDAFGLACLMKKSGVVVDLLVLGELSQQTPESSSFRQSWEQEGGVTQPWQNICPDCELIVDGLLGIGLTRELDENWISVIQIINKHRADRVSIDIPSGLNADTGKAMPVAIQADLTVSFIGKKMGCFLADGPDYCGEIVFDNLGLATELAEKISAGCQLLNPLVIQLPAKRKKNSFKNQYGHVLVIGGGPCMSGATRLAGMAALRTGAGLVSLSVHPDNVTVASCLNPELMVTDWSHLDSNIKQASIIVVGPGLGQSKQAKQVLQKLSLVDQPMVIDADALQVDFLDSVTSLNCIITPHPGEAARLLGIEVAEIQNDRMAALNALNDKWSMAAVLKGAGSLVGSAKNKIKLCDYGHSGMATAGMGDVLAGMVGGYLAQGLNPYQAVQSAVLVHAMAADFYAKELDSDSLIASDVIDRISQVMRDIRQDNGD